jgi:hypothetical protein
MTYALLQKPVEPFATRINPAPTIVAVRLFEITADHFKEMYGRELIARGEGKTGLIYKVKEDDVSRFVDENNFFAAGNVLRVGYMGASRIEVSKGKASTYLGIGSDSIAGQGDLFYVPLQAPVTLAGFWVNALAVRATNPMDALVTIEKSRGPLNTFHGYAHSGSGYFPIPSNQIGEPLRLEDAMKNFVFDGSHVITIGSRSENPIVRDVDLKRLAA